MAAASIPFEEQTAGLDQLQDVNLSALTLTWDKLKVLKKGLSFVPTTKFDDFEWTKDLNLFVRKLKWARFFHKKKEKCTDFGVDMEDLEGMEVLEGLLEEGTRPIGEGPFTMLRNKNCKPPPFKQHSCIDTFNDVVTIDFRQLTATPKKLNHNLTPSEFKALMALEKNNAIIIKSSDKGG